MSCFPTIHSCVFVFLSVSSLSLTMTVFLSVPLVFPFLCTSYHLSLWLSSPLLCPCTWLSVCKYLFHTPGTCMSAWLYVHTSTLFLYMSVCLWYIKLLHSCPCPSIYLPLHPCLCLYVCLSVHTLTLSLSMSIWLYLYFVIVHVWSVCLYIPLLCSCLYIPLLYPC